MISTELTIEPLYIEKINMCKYSSSSSKVEVRLYKNYLGELNETCEIICENVGQIKFIFIKTALSRDALIQLLPFAI